MKKEFKAFKGISYYEIEYDRILCSYNVLLDRIRISTGFFKKLNEDEAHFMLAHEEGHRLDRRLYLIILLSTFLNMILALFSFLITITIEIHIEWLMIIMILTMTSLFLLIIFYRIFEFHADEHAAKKVHYKHFISAMEKIEKENYPMFIKVLGKLTHPSIKSRMGHLSKLSQMKIKIK